MTPILYSFRRCPYAMRARLALHVAGVQVELREIKLRDKPDEFLQASQSATVPCLVTSDAVIDESLDVMVWALRQNDPEGWLDMPQAGWTWITRFDGPFKAALDRTKYASRYVAEDAGAQRAVAAAHLDALDAQIGDWLFDAPRLVDYAILPFVRQFAFVDKAWFDAQNWPHVQRWLARFLACERFAAIMHKHAVWQPGNPGVVFPEPANPT